MTETERKALALVSEVAGWLTEDIEDFTANDLLSALCRAIEQHEAFKREISDAVEKVQRMPHSTGLLSLARFIIAKPDPLVEALHDCGVDRFETWADQLRAALAARGLKIVEDKA